MDELLDELRLCPFCGSKPEISGGTYEVLYRRKESQKPWRRFLRKETRTVVSRGKEKQIDFFVFLVSEYKVRCTGKHCVARSGCLYHSEIEAINAWNGGSANEHS